MSWLEVIIASSLCHSLVRPVRIASIHPKINSSQRNIFLPKTQANIPNRQKNKALLMDCKVLNRNSQAFIKAFNISTNYNPAKIPGLIIGTYVKHTFQLVNVRQKSPVHQLIGRSCSSFFKCKAIAKNCYKSLSLHVGLRGQHCCTLRP